MKLPWLPRRHTFAFVLLFIPALQGCSSVPTTLALYGIKALVSVSHSNESAYGYYQLGKYLQQRDQLDAAASAYEKALSIDPDYVEAKNALGVVSSRQRRLDLAIEHFRSALSQAPRSSHVHNNLGHAYYLQGRYTEAIESLETAARLDSRNAGAIHTLALAYQAAGLADQAEMAFRKYAALRATYASPRGSAVVEHYIGGRQPVVQMEPSVNTHAANPLAKPTLRSSGNNNSIITDASNAAGRELSARLGDKDATLVLLEPNVYELRDPTVLPLAPLRAVGIPQFAGATPNRLVQLEVANGNGIPGLARSVADQLKRAGFRVVRVTNERPYTRATSELQYREHSMDDARRLASLFQKSVTVARSQVLHSTVQLRLVLGSDTIRVATLLKPATIPPDGETTFVAQR